MKIKYADGVKPTEAATVYDEVSSISERAGEFTDLKRDFQAILAEKQSKGSARFGSAPGVSAARLTRRAQQRDAARQAKKATRNWRRSKIEALDNESNVLGLARVYVLGRGTPAMRQNVILRVRELAQQVSAAQDVHLDRANEMITERFNEVLARHGEEVPA